MALTKEEIESLYSRIPILRPPPSVFVLRNADVNAERLYDATHRLNSVARDQVMRYKILGMHEMGTPFVLLAGDAPETTAIHEAVHYMGVSSEPATRAITRALYLRSRLNLGLRTRPVRYATVDVSPRERDGFLRSMRLDNPSGQPVDLVHLVYTPG